MSNLLNDRAETAFSRICSPGYLRGWRTSATTASLTWDEPYAQCHLCPDAVAYEISGEGIATVEVIRPPCELKALIGEREYHLAVRAKGGANIISDASHVTIRRIPGATEPRNLRVTANSNRVVSIAWDGPLDHTPIGYSVMVVGKVTDVTQPHHTLFNMLVGVPVYIGVRTRLAGGGVSVFVYILVQPNAWS